MLQAFVITLREGLEAFLIVAISLAYLRKSGRRELIPAVHWGIALSLFISIGAAYLFHRAANHSLWEGLLAIIAALSVASLTVHMWRTSRHQRRDRRALERGDEDRRVAFAGVFLFTLLMITREDGDGAADGHAAVPADADAHRGGRRDRHRLGGVRGVAVVATATG